MSSALIAAMASRTTTPTAAVTITRPYTSARAAVISGPLVRARTASTASVNRATAASMLSSGVSPEPFERFEIIGGSLEASWLDL